MDELAPVADVFAQFAQRWWGDPGLGQTSQAEQVDQVRGIAFIVLHPPMPPVVAQRMGQVHRGPALLDHVSRPVPAIGRFEYHLWMLAGLGQLGRQGDGVVVDADRVERLPASFRRTITLRRRCRSMPTYCCCCSTGAPSVVSGLVWEPQVCFAHLVPGDRRTPAGSSIWVGGLAMILAVKNRSSCSACGPCA